MEREMAMALNVRKRQHLLLLIVVGMILHSMKTSAAPSSGDDTKRCREEEREALLEILPLELVRRYFLPEHECCNWPGVYCSNITGRIFRLDSRFFTLACEPLFRQFSLHPLLRLNDLLYLDVDLEDCYLNDFSQIPDYIGSFHKLRNLTLSSSLFSGLIPPQLGNLTNLQSLKISFGYDNPGNIAQLYAKNMNWLSHLPSLNRLVLHNIDLRGATDWIKTVNNLPSLTYLDLHQSYLPTFIPSLLITNFSNSLTFVDLSETGLKASSTWTWLFNCSSLLGELRLSQNRLEGSIPSGVKSLASLSYLDLSNNHLEGPIPSEVRSLTALSYLDLSDNHLEGPIPSGIRNATSLSHLDLSFNQLEGEFSYSIKGLCNLHTINLSHNKLSGDLTSIFRSLSCSAKSLKFLFLNHNQLSGSFPDVNRLESSLQSDLISRPWSLVIINLQKNQLTGSIPDVSAFSLSLKVLHLQGNKLNGTVHVSLGELSSLKKLDISSNSLKGQIFADHLSNLSSLRYLDISFNSLTFSISSNWVPPFRLIMIGLASCNLGPHFPEWLQTQRDYNGLDMSNAGISGTIPLWFWNLSSVATFIGLSYNKLEGTLPNKSSVFYMNPNVDLSSNNLEGAIPSFLADALYLNLSRNSFSGSISSLCLGRYNFFSGLDLSHNFLSGNLPSCLKKIEIGVLDLSNNDFSGNPFIPLGPLGYDFWSLHLENNRFSGELNLSSGNSSDLHYLDLGGNLFSGRISTWIGERFPNMVTLSLRNNSLLGNIPRELCRLSSLQVLDLSMNDLSEGIPDCFWNFTAMGNKKEKSATNFFVSNGTFDSVGSRSYKDHATITLKGFMYEYKNLLALLKSIDLSSNKLEGEIPVGISSLSGLVSLNLSQNNLNGSITSKIGQLTSLESLDLSQNRLSGEIPASISDLSFLGTLNLANNSLSGRIPSGTQIEGFNASVFEGNPGLCGEPLPKKCSGDGGDKVVDGGGSEGNADDERHERLGLYVSIILGFITGFWGVCGALVLKTSWRHAYFRFWIRVYDRLYVVVALKLARR